MILAALVVAASTFAAGETLDYSLSWLGMTGGDMRMSIAAEGEGRLRIHSVAHSNSAFERVFKVRDDVTSIVALRDLSTLRYEKRLDERGTVREDVTVVDENGLAVRRREGKEPESVATTRPTFDPLSLIYRLRMLELTPGSKHVLAVVTEGQLYQVEARVTGREDVRTPAGRFRCVVVEPKMIAAGIFRDGKSRMRIWYSDDAAHLPVRIRSDVKIGAITATLVRIEPPPNNSK